jgi:hypothetical protein
MISKAVDTLTEEIERNRDDPETDYMVSKHIAQKLRKRILKGGEIDTYHLPDSRQVGRYLSQNREDLGLIRYESDSYGLPTRWAFGRVQSLDRSENYDRVDGGQT